MRKPVREQELDRDVEHKALAIARASANGLADAGKFA